MSTISNKQSTPEFDYWEFVHCAVCFLPFTSDVKDVNPHPPTVPFWLTECGHSVCNSHLRVDQSCAACGAMNIQLIPLQRELSPPMSEWFKSIPRALDTVSATVRFQQDTMAALVRFYKGKCMQQRSTINRAREIAIENKALKSQIEQLQQENIQLRQAIGMNNVPGAHLDPHYNRPRSFSDSTFYEPGDFRNTNGKRPTVPVSGFQQNRSSSPRIITTPRPPSRLTLPSDHPQPEGRNEGSVNINENRDPSNTTRFGQFAYQPPQTPSRSPSSQRQQFHFRPQRSSLPGFHVDTNNPEHEPRQRQQQQRSMPPPPSPVQRQPSFPMKDPPRTTRGQFRPASTSILHSANVNPDRRHTDVKLSSNIPSAQTMPVTPSTNRFFAPTPQTANLNQGININHSSGNRTPFIPRQG